MCLNVIYKVLIPLRYSSSPGIKNHNNKKFPRKQYVRALVVDIYVLGRSSKPPPPWAHWRSDIVVQTTDADESTQYISVRKDVIHKNGALLFYFYISKKKNLLRMIKPDQVV